MKSAFHARKEEGSGLNGYALLVLFIAAAGFASMTVLGNEWNSLMYTLRDISAH